MKASRRWNHGTLAPLRWMRQPEPFLLQGKGVPIIIIHRPAVLALRTGKARFALRERVEPYAWGQIPESNWHILLGGQSVCH